MKSKRIWLIWLLAIVLMSSPGIAQGGGFEDGFDNPELPGWDHPAGARVEEGVLILETGQFVNRPGEWALGRMSIVLRLGQSGDVAIAYQTHPRGAFILVVSFERLILQKEENGAIEELSSAPIDLPRNEWVHLEIVVEGSSHRVMANGEPYLVVDEVPPFPPGGIVIEMLGEGQVQVEEVTVQSSQPPGGEDEQPPDGEDEQPPDGEDEQPSDVGGETAGMLPRSQWTWIRTGGPLGGLGYDVRMRPDDPDHMYVTDAYAGVFISEDGGKTWYPSNQGLMTVGGPSGDAVPIFSLTIDPNNYDTIWVGMQNVRGVYRSDDGGQTWQERTNGIQEMEGITFRGFTVEPGNSDVVYAMAEVSSWAWAGEERVGREFDLVQGVVYKTVDGGQTWTAIWRGNNLARYLWIDPRDTDVLYLSTGIFDREAADSDPISGESGGEGVLKSTDGGQTWTPANNGLDNLYVGSLFMHPEDPDILLAGTGNNQYYQNAGVYLTTDGAQTWDMVMPEGIQAVEFASSDPNIGYAGNPGFVARTEDGGQTWDQITPDQDGWGPPGVRAGFPIDFQVDPRDPDRVFANNYGGGNFVSEDGGQTWVIASNGYTGAQVRAISVDPTEPARVYAAARSGIFVSQDGGTTWQGLSYPPGWTLEWNALAINPETPDHVIAADNWSQDIYYSSQRGRDWQLTHAGLGGAIGVSDLVFAPSDPSIAYAAIRGFFSAGSFSADLNGGGIYRSDDGGRSWEPVGGEALSDANASRLAVHPQDPDIVYAAVSNMGLLHSTDGGDSWSVIQGEWMEGSPLLSVEINPHNPDDVFVGLLFGGAYISHDGGLEWSRIAAGLAPEATITEFVFHPTNHQWVFMADQMSGVYVSEDGGASWLQVTNGLSTRAVNAMAFSADGLHLYAATEGGGVFRLDLNGQPPTAAEGSAPIEPSGQAAETPQATEDSEAADQDSGFQLPCLGGSASLFLAAGLVVVSLRRRK